MATYKKRAVEGALQTKGFRRKETHHSFFIYYTEDGLKTPVQTKTSHGRSGTDIDGRLIGRMAKQCKLTASKFSDLVDCPLSRAGYERHLRDNGYI